MKKNKMDTQEYQFIKETVKKQPKENGSLLRRLLMIAGCGVLFGGCAAVTFASVFPVMADREENTQQKIELTGSDVAETISEEQATERESVASVSEQEEKSLLAMRQEMYREVLKVSQKSRKSLVNVRGISKDEDLLNNSYFQQEDTEGLVFLETETQFYILTYEEELENLQELQVTFADGSTVQGEICRGDADSGFAVATVRKNLLNDSTREGIVVSDLTDTKKLGQSDIVIAIGSPAGDSDAVVYGMITSVSEKLSAADTEYNVLATDVQGNEDGSGVLLDSDGNGHVGAGLGKATEIPEAIRKGKEDAAKNLISVALDENDSVTHDYIGKFGGASVLLKKAPEGTGVIAGGPARAVIEMAGIKNIRTKSLGSNNKQNVVLATIEGLRQIKTPEEVAKLRGKSVEEIFG